MNMNPVMRVCPADWRNPFTTTLTQNSVYTGELMYVKKMFYHCNILLCS